MMSSFKIFFASLMILSVAVFARDVPVRFVLLTDSVEQDAKFVKLEKDTVWLTQNQMAELFGVDRTSIVRHIRNIYKAEELDEISTCAKNAQVRFEGSRKNIIQIFRVVWRRIEHHLIVILQHIT